MMGVVNEYKYVKGKRKLKKHWHPKMTISNAKFEKFCQTFYNMWWKLLNITGHMNQDFRSFPEHLVNALFG